MNMAESPYYYEIRKLNTVKKRIQDLMPKLLAIFSKHQGRYSFYRVPREPVNKGWIVDLKRVQRLMHEMNFLGQRMKDMYSYNTK